MKSKIIVTNISHDIDFDVYFLEVAVTSVNATVTGPSIQITSADYSFLLRAIAAHEAALKALQNQPEEGTLCIPSD